MGRVSSFPVALYRAASDLLSRAQLGQGGLTFAGKRNVFEALGYKTVLTARDFRDRYRRGGVARRVVRAAPEATWRGGAELIDDEDPDVKTSFEESWIELQERLGIWSVLQRADILAGLGRYAVVLIGAPGDMASELARLRPEDVAYLQAFGEDDVVVESTENDLESPRFGLPIAYGFKRISSEVGRRTGGRSVHWTRVIHVADDTLDDRVYGTPRLEPVWNDLDDLDKIKGAGAEAFWRRAHQGLVFKVDKDVALTDTEKKSVQDAADELVHDLRRTMAVRGMDVTPLGSDVANIGNPIDAVLTVIAGSTGIPKRILMGSERGELASTQDRENWEQRIRDRRTDFAEPIVVRPLVDRLIERGALPDPIDGYEVRWPDMESLTRVEQATVAKTWAELSGAAGETVVTGAEIRDRVLRLEPLEEDRETRVDREEDAVEVEPDDDAMSVGRVARGRHSRGWRVTHDVADRHRARIVAVVLSAIRVGVDAVDRELLMRGFEERRESWADAALAPVAARMREAADAELRWEISRVLGDAGDEAARSAVATGTLRSARLSLSFDRVNPEALLWAKLRSAGLVTAITEETRLALRDAMRRAFAEGLSPQAAARLIEPLIGLTGRQADAVRALREAMRDGAGRKIWAGKVAIRVPKDGASDTLIELRAKQYAERLLRQRAVMIARTETIAASNEGQRQLWLQAVDGGLLTGEERRVWIVTPDDRLCPICEELDGEVRGLSENFSVGVMGPPAHPDCRCATGLTTDGAK